MRGDSVAVEDVRSVNVWPYVGFYSLMMIGLTVLCMAILIMFPSLAGSFSHASGFVIVFGSTSFATHQFIRRNLRLFNRSEYWRITLFSSLVSCLVSLLLGGLAIAGGGIPGSDAIPPLGWLVILLIAGLVAFGTNALGYAMVGKHFLKAVLARQARINADTFR